MENEKPAGIAGLFRILLEQTPLYVPKHEVEKRAHNENEADSRCGESRKNIVRIRSCVPDKFFIFEVDPETPSHQHDADDE